MRGIEHGQLMDEATARLLADKGVRLCLQTFTADRPSAFPEGSPNRLKQLEVARGTDAAYRWAKQFGIQTAWGSDVLFTPEAAREQIAALIRLTNWFTPAEALRMVTSVNAELLALSGPRNPYPGKLGVVEEGALADLLLVDGDPLADLRLLGRRGAAPAGGDEGRPVVQKPDPAARRGMKSCRTGGIHLARIPIPHRSDRRYPTARERILVRPLETISARLPGHTRAGPGRGLQPRALARIVLRQNPARPRARL